MFNRAPGAGSYTFTMRPNIAVQLREEAVTQALQTIERRVNELGVAEPIVARHSEDDQILVQLPGVTDVAPREGNHPLDGAARAEARRAGPVLRRSRRRVRPTATTCRRTCRSCQARAKAQPGDRPATVYYVVRRVPAVTGRDLRNSRPTLDENSRPAVSFSLNNEGAAKFGDVHAEQHQPPARHRPRQSRLFGADASIAVSTTRASSRATSRSRKPADLSLVLRSGALPATLTYLEERTVGASLGQDSIRAGVTAAIGGLIFVMMFMLVYYRLSGFNALVSIVRQPDHPARPDGVSRRDDDAARASLASS